MKQETSISYHTQEETIQRIYLLLQNSINRSTATHILLSGGNTPIPILERFDSLSISWKNVNFWLADERCYPLDHLDRNETIIRKALGKRILSQVNFHSLPDGEPNSMARIYSQMVKEVPFFDIALLGIGEDGHTASLFPENEVGEFENSPDVLCISNSPKPPMKRVSLSLNKINNSKFIFFLVTCESKKEVILRIQKGDNLPAAKVKGLISTEIICLTD
jgi:6-phosphogluconolactonase